MRPNAEDLGIWARGLLMGAADVVPGVSGGTVALIVGIYGRLVNAIASIDAQFLRLLQQGRLREAAERAELRFLIALGLGIAMAILTLSKLITWLILNKPVPTWSLFFGMIVGSSWLVYRQVSPWSASAAAAAALGAGFAWWICGLLPGEGSGHLAAIFLSAVIAICAMILPGISGSFILIVLGQYLRVLEALHQRDLVLIAVFCAGCATGLLAFSRLLKFLLREFNATTMALLCGLMVGSLRKIWPFKMELPGQELLEAKHRIQVNVLPQSFDGAVLLALVLAIAGAALVLFLDRASGKSCATRK